MKSPCDICVDPQCGGKKNCDCDNCDKKDICYRILKPIYRITRKCTQSCSHCCFECSPKASEMMSVEVAKKAQQFNKTNNIIRAEAMGGEFYLNPNWEEILDLVGDGLEAVRLVTCGDWAANPKIAARVIEFLQAHKQFYVALSKDQWHKNEHVDAAEALMKEAGIIYRIPTEEEVKSDSIVPVGRGELHYGMYSFMMTYCSKPERRYSFLVDEQGEIYKCGLGVWDYDNISGFTEGGFAKRFKEFNTKFYNIFISNCAVCRRSYRRAKMMEEK